MVKDGQIRNIIELANQLGVIQERLEENPNCYNVLQMKADNLQEIVDRSRSALVLSATEARRAKREREENGCKREQGLSSTDL